MRYVKRIWGDCIAEVVGDPMIASILVTTSSIALAVITLAFVA